MIAFSLPVRLSAVALAATVAFAPAASAQRIASPAGVRTPTLGGSPAVHHKRMNLQPQQIGGHRAPIHVQPRPIYVQPRPRVVPAPGFNPIVNQNGFVDTEYDPFTDVLDVNRQTLSTRLSAYDPNRDHVDPGSLRRVDRWIRVNGRLVREHGMTWTSYGVPHGNLTRDSSTFTPNNPYPTPYPSPYPSGGVRENDSDTVIFSTGPQPGQGGVRENDSHSVLYSTAPQPGQGAAPSGGVRKNDRKVMRYSLPR
ncbi:hypothetical protein [Alienimonas chondri]|uniref:Secreted protein n=1 Tax=Alienimonas chondri TaxID=2681879 RepID=A0ABX1VCT3_9PLAN|nr:hypothetical protein [Alienimonas chondri]NNJ25519.1 hypothetical protein [Alienimonas chondri]